MPFVVGILASELNEVLMLPMDEVLIINLDEDCFIRTPDPEMSDLDYLPPGSIDNLKKSLKDTCRMIKSIFNLFYFSYLKLLIIFSIRISKEEKRK